MINRLFLPFPCVQGLIEEAHRRFPAHPYLCGRLDDISTLRLDMYLLEQCIGFLCTILRARIYRRADWVLFAVQLGQSITLFKPGDAGPFARPLLHSRVWPRNYGWENAIAQVVKPEGFL